MRLWLSWSTIITVYILNMRCCCAGPTPHHIIHCLCNDHRTVFTCYNCAIKFPKPHKGHLMCSDVVTDTFTFLFFKTNIPNFLFWMLWIGVVFEDRSNWSNDGTLMEKPSHAVAAWVEGDCWLDDLNRSECWKVDHSQVEKLKDSGSSFIVCRITGSGHWKWWSSLCGCNWSDGSFCWRQKQDRSQGFRGSSIRWSTQLEKRREVLDSSFFLTHDKTFSFFLFFQPIW